MRNKFRKIVFILALAVFVFSAWLFLNKRGETDIVVDAHVPRITVTSSSFEDLGVMPEKHTGRGADISPDLKLLQVSGHAVSIAVIMDDIDIPWAPNYTHWVIWDIPAADYIPEGIAHGEMVLELNNAKQGIAYGKHMYRGLMPPFGTHRYMFHVFVLDSFLELDASCSKDELIKAMDGHILQYGSLTGWYPKADN